MNKTDISIETILRIPGSWESPRELIERLPPGFRLTPDALIMPDATEIEMSPRPPDDEFADIFESSCRQPAAADELTIVRNYAANICLIGPGGSLDAATKMMHAGAAIVRAGGAGVFIDNSGLSHGGRNWIEMAEDASSDALSFAFVTLVQEEREVWTIGMHVLGFPEIVMRRADAHENEDTFIDVIRYVCQGDRPIGDGHVLAFERAPCFRVVAVANEGIDPEMPMFNPFGRLKLVSLKDLADSN